MFQMRASMLVRPKTDVVMPTSTQWRLLFPSGTTTANPIVTTVSLQTYEVQMRSTSGGADQCVGGTATASSQFSSTFSADKAFDDDEATRWVTTASGQNGSWLQYTFGSAITINEVTFKCVGTAGPTSLRLQYYDGSTWQTHFEEPGMLTWTSGETKTFTYTSPFTETGYTKWRLYITTAAPGTLLGMMEVEMKETSSGDDRCFGGIATASSELDTNHAAPKAFDNNSISVPWSPSNNASGEYLAYEFWRKEVITHVNITEGGDTDSNPQEIAVQYYDPDLTSWVTSWSFNPPSWTASGTVYSSTKP